MSAIEDAAADLIKIAIMAHANYRKYEQKDAEDWTCDLLKKVGVNVKCYADCTKYYYGKKLIGEIKLNYETK